MAAVDSGRQRNPGVPQDDGGGLDAVGRYWTQWKYKALSMVSDEPPPDAAVLAEMPPEQGYVDGLAEMTDLSYTQRITGFFMMMGMGVLFILFGMMMWMRPIKFSFFMTCGNIFCLCSTMFLAGCAQQLRTMFEANRFEAACLYVLSVACTLLSALWLKSKLLSIVFALAQLVAILWYALSFLPYARQTLTFAASYASMVLGPIVNVVVRGVSSCLGAIFS
ncbi:Got1/Sft2-like family [Novymonas esmeraldas]|uniref:Vesicle transport protein n=1 Tax=Novymonas esmeraldas TaxID=1808958 RepID=A0AAW0EUS9_9TRYP